MSGKDKILIAAGATGLILVVGTIGLFLYGLMTASIITLRWWAGLATVAVPVVALLAYALGKQAARERIAGLEQGIGAVTEAARRTVDTARQTAAVRAEAAARQRQGTPAIQQVFLPGLPSQPPLSPPIVPIGGDGETAV